MELRTNPDSINYQAEIIEIKEYKKHPNADKLFIVNVNFNTVITGVEPKVGDTMVYFPVMSKLNPIFLSYINGFIESTLNKDTNVKGFFTNKCRVKPIKLRGLPSEGYLHPIKDINDFFKVDLSKKDVGISFNQIDSTTLCDKYIIPTNANKSTEGKTRQQKSVKINRLVDNQFRLHVDTENLRKNVFKISPEDIIGIHYKKHGTSWVVGNVLIKRQLSWLEKLAKRFGIKVTESEHDFIYSSRKVVKNGYLNTNPIHYYSYDLWEDIKDLVKDKIPKGYTLYGEALGFTKGGAYIQKDYDYGCKPEEMKLYVYRITNTNEDGFKIELTDNQIKQFCDKYDLNYNDTMIYYGKAKDLYPKIPIDQHWHENLLLLLQEDHNEKDCYMCVNKVPEEGIVVTKESLFEYEAYKLKSFRFLDYEDKQLEAGEGNIEDNQELQESNEEPDTKEIN